MAKNKEYTKIAGPGLMAYQRLYQAKDHFLVIDGVYVETYHRLYYKDIQALIFCPTKAGTITMWASALCLLICSIGTIVTLGSDIFGLWLVPAIIAGVVLLCAAVSGGTCRFAIKTSEHVLVLNSVNGRRKARKLMSKISGIVESVQGKLTQDALDEAFSKAHAAANTPYPAPGGAPPILS